MTIMSAPTFATATMFAEPPMTVNVSSFLDPMSRMATAAMTVRSETKKTATVHILEFLEESMDS